MRYVWAVLIGATVWAIGSTAQAEPSLREAAFAGPMKHVSEIVFAARRFAGDGHWYANFAYYASEDQPKAYAQGGQLCKLDVATGQVKVLLDAPEGSVRDPVVHYDGKTILFAYRKPGTEHFHLYTIQSDGSGLTQLTDGDYDDLEPCWLPDGDIVFVSSRCKRWVNCWLTQVAVMYRCKPDGSGIHQLSANIEHDNTPWVLPDGRIIYQRWEYIDRSQVHYHHLWTINPDGTGQMTYFGNLHGGTLMIDAKPIPNTEQVVAIFSPGHGRREHAGAVTIVNPADGPDARSFARELNPDKEYRDPYAFSADCILVARGPEMQLMNGAGKTEVIYCLPEEMVKAGYQMNEPRPIVSRQRERIIAPRIDPSKQTGKLILANVYEGRAMADVKPGEIKKLLVVESLPKPINYTGGMDPLSYGGTFTLERIIGTVPVEPDGSAYMQLPAMRSLFFVALDENDLSVKRMHSFVSVMPGEVTSCVGCHEQRTQTTLPTHNLMAMAKSPAVPEPIADVPDVFDYPRDIQPILDALCVSCHGYDKTEKGGPFAGRLILTGDHGPMFSHSYYMMTIAQLFSDGRNRAQSNYAPRVIGSSASQILKMLDGSHYGVKATPHQYKMLRLWIETAAAYPGTYAALGTGMIGGYYSNHPTNVDWEWPTTKAGAAVIDRKCQGCHNDKPKLLPRALSDERGVSFWQPNLNDARLAMSRHIVFNLTRPEKSLMLLAPLAQSVGGYGICKNADGKPADVFTSVEDADYQTLLKMIDAGRANLADIKRFDMPGFRPRGAYIRELKRYGVLPPTFGDNDPIDPYATDRAYWESLWYQPRAD